MALIYTCRHKVLPRLKSALLAFFATWGKSSEHSRVGWYNKARLHSAIG